MTSDEPSKPCEPEPPADPLDQPSSVYVERSRVVDGKKVVTRREMTFRELSYECKFGSGQMSLWDSIGRRLREKNQQANDPAYVPIQPGAGLRRARRERLMLKRAERMLQDIAGIRRRDQR